MKRADQLHARRAPTRRVSPVVFLVACATLLLGCVDAQDPAAVMQPATDASRGQFRVGITDGLVTVAAHNTSVRSLLDEIARQSDFVVVSHVPLAARVTLQFERLPLREALDVILRGQSFALQDVQPSSRPGNSSAGQLRKLWVFSKGPVGESISPHFTSVQRLENLDSLDAEDLIEAMSLALIDSDANARTDAASTLADVGNDQAAAALARAALNDGDSSVRQEAVYALGIIGGEIGIRTLRQALIDPDNEVREAAIQAFANIGGDSSATALAVVLNDSDASLRAEAVDALGEIGGETATRLLRQALADERSSIREDAAELLAEADGD